MNSKLLPWYTCDASVFGHVLTASKFVVQACDIQGNDLPELWSGLLRAPAGRRPWVTCLWLLSRNQPESTCQTRPALIVSVLENVPNYWVTFLTDVGGPLLFYLCRTCAQRRWSHPALQKFCARTLLSYCSNGTHGKTNFDGALERVVLFLQDYVMNSTPWRKRLVRGFPAELSVQRTLFSLIADAGSLSAHLFIVRTGPSATREQKNP